MRCPNVSAPPLNRQCVYKIGHAGVPCLFFGEPTKPDTERGCLLICGTVPCSCYLPNYFSEVTKTITVGYPPACESKNYPFECDECGCTEANNQGDCCNCYDYYHMVSAVVPMKRPDSRHVGIIHEQMTKVKNDE
jgi:hypothetical protein